MVDVKDMCKTIEEFKTRTFNYGKLSLKYWVDKIKLIN